MTSVIKTRNLPKRRACWIIKCGFRLGFPLLLIVIAEICAQGSASLAQTYTISGQVTDGFGNAISGWTVRLSGTQTDTRTTDNLGNYSFSSLQAGGNYIVGPASGGQNTLVFSTSVNNLSSDVTVNLQVLFFVTFQVWIRDASGIGIPSVGVKINDDPFVFAQTNSFGKVNIGVNIPVTNNGPPATLTPEKPGYVFSPPSLTLSTQSGNQVVNFTGTTTPTPPPIQLILDTSGPVVDQVAALDSILFLRDPFPVLNGSDLLNLGSDRNTRVIIFVTNLQLAQGETSSAVVVNLIDSNSQVYDVTAEDVRPVPGFDFTQVIFRLPNNLPAGTCAIKIKAHGQVSNAGTIRIGT